MTPCDQCQPYQLEQLFHETLPEAVADDVANHVAVCVVCQQILESFAAEQKWWHEASRRLNQSSIAEGSFPSNSMDQHVAASLKPNPFRAAIRTSDGPTAPDARESDIAAELSDDVYASDFAVDFLEPSDDAASLGRLGEYEIVEVIGRGGMGIVLKGFQKELHRFVAVKVLAPHLATSGAARRRFAREAQATAAVVNPHVMAIHSVHASSKLPYLVMPYVACESLQQRLDQRGPLDLKDILRIGMQAALGLAAAHAQGLVHRDVKPANILLETNVDRVMLTDFGLARAVDDATLTRTGIIAGTPQYMSPEQANGDAVDHRSDLFSLGSVLYAMSTARPPFRAETTFGILRRIRETNPRPIREINSDIPDWLERIILTLLDKHPEARIASAVEVATLLEHCLKHVQQPTIVSLPAKWTEAPASVERRNRNWMNRTSYRSWVVGVFGVAASIAIGAMLFSPPSGGKNNVTERAISVPSEAEPTSKSSTEPKMVDPVFDWDHTQTELRETHRALMRFEHGLDLDQEEVSHE